MKKDTLIIAGGVYFLGFVGMFITKFMELYETGWSGYALGEAALRALIWPIEIVRLFL